MIFKHMDRIVFAGDSVTDMESAQPVGEGLFENVGKSYVRIVENMLAAFYPEVYLRVTNSGIGGNTSRDLVQRFDRDVVSLKPDWVSICIGINDVWRQFDSPAIPDEQVSPEEYRSMQADISQCMVFTFARGTDDGDTAFAFRQQEVDGFSLVVGLLVADTV